MILTFPLNPVPGQEYTAENGQKYSWTGNRWQAVVGFTIDQSLNTTDSVQFNSIAFTNGDDANGSHGWNQIAFGYDGTTDWSHFIRTRHNDSEYTGNAIDFYTNANQTGGPNDPILGLSIEAGNIVLGNDIHAQPSNDMNLKVFDPGVEGAGVAISLQNRNADSGSKTTQLDVNPDSIRLTTDFSGAQNEWVFGDNGILTLPINVAGNSTIYSTAGDVQLYTQHSGDATVKIRAKGDGGDSQWLFHSDGSLTTPGHVVPDADNVYDLGSPTAQWRHIYVSTGSIYLGNVKLSTDQGKLDVTNVSYDIVDGEITNETVVDNYALTNQDRLVKDDKSVLLTSDGTLTVPGTINAHDLIKGRDKVGDYYSWNITGLAMLDIGYGFTQGDLTIDGLWPLAGKVQVVISGIEVPAEANGTWYAESRTGNTVYLFSDENTPLDISSWSGYTGGGTLEVEPLTYDLNISAGVSYPNSDNGHVNITTDDGNDTYTWKFDNKGNLTLSGSVIASGGRYYQDCSDSWTSFRWVNAVNDGEPVEIGRVYADGGTPYTGDESEANERTQFGYQEIDEGVSSFYIIATQNADGIGTDEGDDRKWVFRGDGDLELPGGLKKEDQVLTFTAIDPESGFTGLQVDISEPYTNTVIFGNNEKGLMVQAGGAVAIQSGLNTEAPVIIAGAWGNTEGTDGGDVLIYGGYSYDGTEGRVFVEGSEIIVGGFTNINLWAGESAEWNFYGDDSSMEFPDGTLQYTAYQGATIVSDTAPENELGRLWFNSLDGRMYVKYNDNWVDASPAIVPSPETYLEGLTIEETTISAVERDTPVSVDGGLTVSGNITVAGDLVPDTDHSRSLGTAERRFAELHVDVIDGGDASSWLLPV